HSQHNTTFEGFGDSEILDNFAVWRGVWRKLGLGDIYHGVLPWDVGEGINDVSAHFFDTQTVTPYVDRVTSVRMKALGSLGEGRGGRPRSFTALLLGVEVGAAGDVSDVELRSKAGKFLKGPDALGLLNVAVRGDGRGTGRGGVGEEVKFKPFQVEALVEELVGEVRMEGSLRTVGRTVLLEAPCGGGKTLIPMFMALVKQHLLEGGTEGGTFFVTPVVYYNVNVALDQLEEYHGVGLRAILVGGSDTTGISAQAAIEIAERERLGFGGIVVLFVCDSLLKPRVKGVVQVWIDRGWVNRFYEDEVHELGTQWKIRAGAAGSFENYTDWCRGEWGRKVREGGVEGGVERWIKC
ncbi:hypothetical protein TrCOL_g10075, partial [Triparma columacea]